MRSGLILVALVLATATPPALGAAESRPGESFAATRATTSAEIFLGNLDSRITATARVLERRRDPRVMAMLARDYLERAAVLGKLEDLERSVTLSQRAFEAAPDDQSVRVTLARALTRVHRFAEALDVLLPLPATVEISRKREALALALGRYGELPPRSNPATAGLPAQVEHAERLFDRGRTGQAHSQLDAAEKGLRSVSPYTAAWLKTRRGILYLREDRLDDAGRSFASAREHLPAYAVATEHLAEVRLRQGRFDEAVSLYTRVAEQTGNPEFYAQLAVARKAIGDDAGAQTALTRAREGFDRWLAAYPEAFADHAVAFYLEQGDPPRALELAELNLRARRTVAAWLLLAETAQVAGAEARGCTAWLGALAIGLQPPELEAARPSFAACDPSVDPIPRVATQAKER